MDKDEFVVCLCCMSCDFVVVLSPFKEKDFRKRLFVGSYFLFHFTCLFLKKLSLNVVLCFAGSPFFRDDTRLRALRFLDHMLVCIPFFF